MERSQFDAIWEKPYKDIAYDFTRGEPDSRSTMVRRAILDGRVAEVTDRMAAATQKMAVATACLAVATFALVAATVVLVVITAGS